VKEQQSRSIYDLLYGAVKKKKKKKKAKEHWYIRFCRWAGKIIGKSAKKELSENYQVALAFLGWKLKPEEINAAPLVVMYIGMILSFLNAFLNYYFSTFVRGKLIMLGNETFLLGRGGLLFGHPLFPLGLDLIWYLGPFVITLLAMYYIQTYPMKAVEKERIKSLTFIPEVVNYLVMAMKVNPNLERAITFAAEHGHGKIADDFKELKYKMQIGEFKTVEEALDHLAWKWGKYSDEFKHALMMIRGSVIEPDETKRALLLDRAIADVLEGVKEKMDMYSRAMRQPSIYLYYFGVLLPLLLIIVIPVGAMMGGESIGFLGSFWTLLFIYNIGIPIATFLLAKSILEKRPPTRPMPEIPDDMPGLPKRGWFKIGKYQLPVLFVCIIILAAFVAGGYFLNETLNPKPPSYAMGVKGYIPILFYAGIVVGLVSAISFHIWANNKDKRKVQMELVDIENQFQDTLYVIASRLAEGRPIEDALKHAAEFLPDNPATKRIFKPTLQNIAMMGMTVKTALFDEAYGSLRYVPSDFIRTTMRIVVDSLTLGVQTAARSLMSLSLQLRDTQKVEKALKSMLEDITNMMSTMSIFIAPVVLGITIALQQIIMGAMKSMAEAGIGELGKKGATGPLSAFSMPSIGDPKVLEHAATQGELLFIISIYMIEIVCILMYFASHVNEGDNKLAFRMAIAQALPLAMTIFFGVTFLAMKMTAI